MDTKTLNDSLFYQGSEVSGNIVMINKRQIETVKMKGTVNAILKMVSGQELTLIMDATTFGHLCYQLLLVQHTNG